ncbi:hypothetical protein FKM82_020717 [Ascaphus truei]
MGSFVIVLRHGLLCLNVQLYFAMRFSPAHKPPITSWAATMRFHGNDAPYAMT